MTVFALMPGNYTGAIEFNEDTQQWCCEKAADKHSRPTNIEKKVKEMTPELLRGTYFGAIVDGKPAGYGILRVANIMTGVMTTYRGFWKDGRFHGIGTYEKEFSWHSYKFRGHFANGKKHGYGKEESLSGTIRGRWENDEFLE